MGVGVFPPPATGGRGVTPRGPAEGGARLDQEGTTVRLVPDRCKCGFCGHCSKQLVRERREWLRFVTAGFAEPQLLTLTVDRDGTTTGKGFEGPEAAYEWIHGRRFVARLMAALKVKRWVAVLEFQMETGEGWPHYHIVLDGWVDLKRAWGLWRDRWRVGLLDLEPVKDRQRLSRYLCDYLSKAPEAPEWVWHRMAGIMRVITSARAVLAFTTFRLGRPLKRWVRRAAVKGMRPVLMVHRKRRAGRESIHKRVLACRQTCNAFVVGDSAEGSLKWIGKVPVPLRVFRKLAARLGAGLQLVLEFRVLSWLRDWDDALVRDERGRCMYGSRSVSGLRAVEMAKGKYCQVVRHFGLGSYVQVDVKRAWAEARAA